MVEGYQKYIIKTISYIVLALIAICCIVPFVIVISSSFSTEDAIVNYGYGIFPREISLDGYRTVFQNSTTLWRAYGITILTTAVGSVLSILIISMTAYPLARKDYTPRRGVSFYLYFTMLFSGGAIPLYILITQYLHLRNNILVLIIPMLMNVWNVFVLRTYFASIPTALIEAAKIDGASEFRTFFTIIMPMSVTGVSTIFVLIVMAYWNSWYECLMYMTREEIITLQYFLQRTMSNINDMMTNKSGLISTSEVPSETARMAMCVLAAGPMIFVFMFFQKYFAKGINMGSVKG